MPPSERGAPPSTNIPDDALSATVSTIEILQSLIRLSTISIAGDDEVRGPQDVARDHRAIREVAAQHERDLGLDPGLEQSRARDGLAITACHLGEQHAEVGRVDAHLALHRRRRQADLSPHPARSGPAQLDDPLLHGVGVVDRSARQQVEERIARDARRLRLDQATSGGFDPCVAHAPGGGENLWPQKAPLLISYVGSSDVTRRPLQPNSTA